MRDWNVVISPHERQYEAALALLDKLGPVSCTNYFNVLVMRVPDIHQVG